MTNLTLEEIITFLLDAPMFGDLDPTQLSQVVHIMQVQGLRPGQVVFREGDAGDAWYVLYEGEIEVLKDSTLERKVVARLGPLSCFGEMAILDGSTRSATVRALGHATAFRFPRSDFARLLAEDNLAAYKLIHQMALVLVARQRDTTAQLAELLEGTDDELRARIGPIVGASVVAE